MTHWSIFAIAAPLVAGALLLVTLLWRTRQASRVAIEHLAVAKEVGANIPVSLHPIINKSLCMGCGACIAACPEHNVLRIANGTAVLVEATQCIGHGLCASACPVGAIDLVFGSTERAMDLPDLARSFETSRHGVHVVGELGGMGLIKNAMVQGLEVADALHRALGPVALAQPDVVDVAIVGAGPAGLAAALACKANKRSFVVLEQGSVGGTVANYPRQKVVMTDTVELPFYGAFGQARIAKEELLTMWKEALAAGDVQVREGVRVTGIEGRDGAFVVQSTAGDVHARKVVLALGRRGTPRRLDVPGEDLPKVTYNLIDPQQYSNSRVLVVGGSDSALETAIMLADTGTIQVYLAHRQGSFSRARQANQQKIHELIADGRVKALMHTEVRAINATQVKLEREGKQFVLRNDYVIVNVGGTLPDAFLNQLEINTRRHMGTEPQPIPAHGSRSEGSSERAQLTSRIGKTTVSVILAASLLGLIALAAWGRVYYVTPVALRHSSHLHRLLRPAGRVGQWIGLVATIVMMFNFTYSIRKRYTRLKSWGSLGDWLNMHMLIGALTPLLVAFHAAFQSSNLLATATAGSLAVVVATGIFGRFLYGLVPTAAGEPMALADLLAQWQELRARLQNQMVGLTQSQEFRLLDESFAHPPAMEETLRSGILQAIRGHLQLLKAAQRARSYFASGNLYSIFESTAKELAALRTQISLYELMRRTLAVWRVLHIVLSILLVTIIAAHIGVAFYLGYGHFF